MSAVDKNSSSSKPELESVPVQISFCNQVFTPLLSGGLFWAEQNTLLVADLHFEKMSSFARSGQLLPPYDTGATLARLASDLDATNARRVICLGDSFHRDEGTMTLSPKDLTGISDLVSRFEWIWLAGNHDPTSHQLGGTCLAQLEWAGLTLTHEPSISAKKQISGHLHPAAKVRMNGRAVRRQCFAHDERQMILPAYGVSTGSLNVLSKAFAGLFERKNLRVTMIGKDRLYPVATKYLVCPGLCNSKQGRN